MTDAKFVKEVYGATVATILETNDSIVEVQERNDGLYGLIIHARRHDRDQWDDLTAYLKPEHFDLLGSIAQRMRGEVVLRLCEYCQTYRSKPCGEGCAWSPSGRTVNQVADRAKAAKIKDVAAEFVTALDEIHRRLSASGTRRFEGLMREVEQCAAIAEAALTKGG